MKRFFGNLFDDKIVITGDECFHMKKVLRMKEGDKIIACVNDENDYYCQIEKFDKDSVQCIIENIEKNIALPKRDITLFQMMPKKEYFDSIIPKAIELGVNEIQFFTSTHTILKSFKRERVEVQVMTACKQCERSMLVPVPDMIKFDDLLQKLSQFDTIIFAYENELTPFSPDIIKGNKIAVIVGNEAGFTKEEAQKIIEKGATSISLGKRILRCDTAVVATLTLTSVLSGN